MFPLLTSCNEFSRMPMEALHYGCITAALLELLEEDAREANNSSKTQQWSSHDWVPRLNPHLERIHTISG